MTKMLFFIVGFSIIADLAIAQGLGSRPTWNLQQESWPSVSIPHGALRTQLAPSTVWNYGSTFHGHRDFVQLSFQHTCTNGPGHRWTSSPFCDERLWRNDQTIVTRPGVRDIGFQFTAPAPLNGTTIDVEYLKTASTCTSLSTKYTYTVYTSTSPSAIWSQTFGCSEDVRHSINLGALHHVPQGGTILVTVGSGGQPDEANTNAVSISISGTVVAAQPARIGDYYINNLQDSWRLVGNQAPTFGRTRKYDTAFVELGPWDFGMTSLGFRDFLPLPFRSGCPGGTRYAGGECVAMAIWNQYGIITGHPGDRQDFAYQFTSPMALRNVSIDVLYMKGNTFCGSLTDGQTFTVWISTRREPIGSFYFHCDVPGHNRTIQNIGDLPRGGTVLVTGNKYRENAYDTSGASILIRGYRGQDRPVATGDLIQANLQADSVQRPSPSVGLTYKEAMPESAWNYGMVPHGGVTPFRTPRYTQDCPGGLKYAERSINCDATIWLQYGFLTSHTGLGMDAAFQYTPTHSMREVTVTINYIQQNAFSGSITDGQDMSLWYGATKIGTHWMHHDDVSTHTVTYTVARVTQGEPMTVTVGRRGTIGYDTNGITVLIVGEVSAANVDPGVASGSSSYDTLGWQSAAGASYDEEDSAVKLIVIGVVVGVIGTLVIVVAVVGIVFWCRPKAPKVDHAPDSSNPTAAALAVPQPRGQPPEPLAAPRGAVTGVPIGGEDQGYYYHDASAQPADPSPLGYAVKPQSTEGKCSVDEDNVGFDPPNHVPQATYRPVFPRQQDDHQSDVEFIVDHTTGGRGHHTQQGTLHVQL